MQPPKAAPAANRPKRTASQVVSEMPAQATRKFKTVEPPPFSDRKAKPAGGW